MVRFDSAASLIATGIFVICLLGVGGSAGLCSNGSKGTEPTSGHPGVSVITLPGAKIVITERACPSLKQLAASRQHIGDPCVIETMSPDNVVIRAKTMVTSIVATVGHKKYMLPSKGLLDAWGGGRNVDMHTKDRMFGGACYDSEDCVFRGVLDTGRNNCAVAVQWEIFNGKVSRTVFTCSDDIVSYFLTHIDPPPNVTVYN